MVALRYLFGFFSGGLQLFGMGFRDLAIRSRYPRVTDRRPCGVDDLLLQVRREGGESPQRAGIDPGELFDFATVHR